MKLKKSIQIKLKSRFMKKPVAIIQNKKQKRYFTEKGDVINFLPKKFENLPLVFGDKDNFKIFIIILGSVIFNEGDKNFLFV